MFLTLCTIYALLFNRVIISGDFLNTFSVATLKELCLKKISLSTNSHHQLNKLLKNGVQIPTDCEDLINYHIDEEYSNSLHIPSIKVALDSIKINHTSSDQNKIKNVHLNLDGKCLLIMRESSLLMGGWISMFEIDTQKLAVIAFKKNKPNTANCLWKIFDSLPIKNRDYLRKAYNAE